MTEEAPKRDYAVGRGKPPIHSRFEPGQSGNPRGRPRGAVDLQKSLLAELSERVTVTEGGRKVRRSKGEIAIRQLVNKAAQGDHRAMALLFNYHQLRPGTGTETASPQDGDGFGTADDEAVFADMMDAIKRSGS